MIKFENLPPTAKKLVHFLACQNPESNWPKLDYEIEKRQGDIVVRLPGQEIGFVFDAISGEFQGIYNWKE